MDISYGELYLGAVYDAMYRLGYREKDFYINIKPVAGYSRLISGPAFTTKGRIICEKENFSELDLIKYKMYDPKNFLSKPIVLLQADDDYCAHFGDISALIYQKLGAIGFISDGNTRDIEMIDNYKFPVFCTGINPIDSLNHWAIIDYDIPITIKNITIEPMDWIFASKEGIIRVKKIDESAFHEQLKRVLLNEKNIREFLANVNEFGTLAQDLARHALVHGRW